MGGGAWDDDMDLDEPSPTKRAGMAAASVDDMGAGWDEDELDLGDLGDVAGAKAGHGDDDGMGELVDSDVFVVPSAGTSVTTHWCDNSSHAADHVASGSFETAMQLLNRQIAAVNFTPLKPLFITAYTGAYTSLPCLPLAPSLRLPVQRNSQDTPAGNASLPAVAVTLPPIIEDLKAAYRAFFGGKFAEAQAVFDEIFATIPLMVVNTKGESNEVRFGPCRLASDKQAQPPRPLPCPVGIMRDAYFIHITNTLLGPCDAVQIKELVDICREYKTAIRIKNAMAETSPDNAARQIELAAYFTHCNLQVGHLTAAETEQSSRFPPLSPSPHVEASAVLTLLHHITVCSTACTHGAHPTDGYGGGLQVPELHHGSLFRAEAA